MAIQDVRLPTPRNLVFDPLELGKIMALPEIAKQERKAKLEQAVFGDLPKNTAEAVFNYKQTQFENKPISAFVTIERLQEIGLKPETPIKLIKDMTDVLGGKGLSLEDRLAIIDAQNKRQAGREAQERESKKQEQITSLIGKMTGIIRSMDQAGSESRLLAKSQLKATVEQLKSLGVDMPSVIKRGGLFSQDQAVTLQEILGEENINPAQPKQSQIPRRSFQAAPITPPQSGQGQFGRKTAEQRYAELEKAGIPEKRIYQMLVNEGY